MDEVESIDEIRVLKFYFRKPLYCIISVDCEVHVLSIPYVLTGLAVNAVIHKLKKANQKLVSNCFRFGSKLVIAVNVRSQPG